VPKQPDLGTTVNDPKWHPHYKRNDKSRCFIGNAWHSFGEDEGHSRCHRTESEHPTEATYDAVYNEFHPSILGTFDMHSRIT